jgi:nucleoside phosphorylase
MREFSAFLAAVKPKDRVGQYVVLAALFCLSADRQAVTARQVANLLALHMGNRGPTNINDLLRKYKSYVTPTAKGPPLMWLLTPAGVERLRASSGLALATTTPHDSFGCDVGIVCALEHPEFSAVLNAFGGPKAWQDVGDARFSHMYRETELELALGDNLRVVGTTATSMGLTAAAIATTQLVVQYRPRIVLMIGIAAGTRTSDKAFGDVLVADPSVDYNSGKVVQADGIRAFLPDPYPIGLNARLRSVLQRYRGTNPVFDTIREGWKGDLPAGPTRLHLGPLGAADQVIDDPSRVLEIQKNWRKLIGVEMETYGVYRACHEAPDPKPRFVSFKSVCDFAAEKTDSWQEYAAFMAAEFARRFLINEWHILWPKEQT